MLRVLIVDDEPFFRIAIREIIQWENFDCEIIAEASNGKEALNFVQKNTVDIVVIDVQMPVMNGIVFLEQLQMLESTVKPLIIMLSAFSDYEHVRRAFLFGVSDYIVKEDVSEEYVGNVIGKAVSQVEQQLLDSERAARDHERELERMKEQAVRAVFLGENSDTELMESFNRQRGIPICVRIDISLSMVNMIVDQQTARYFSQTILQILHQRHPGSVLVTMDDEEYGLLLIADHKEGGVHERYVLSETLVMIRSHLKQYLNASVTIGVGESCTEYVAWRKQYETARKLTDLRYYDGGGYIYYPEDVSRYITKERSTLMAAWTVKEMLYKIETGQGVWESDFATAVNKMKSLGVVGVPELQSVYKAVLWELGALLHTKGHEWHEVTGMDHSPYEWFERIGTMEETHEWLLYLLRTSFELLDPKRKLADTHPRIVEQAKQLIALHYEKPLSLSLVSEWVGVSESYLSKLFVKETGENFIYYVTKYRIHKAMQMLDSGMKLYEIGEKVGYPNQAHFSKIFKKVTGKTPLQFRTKTE